MIAVAFNAQVKQAEKANNFGTSIISGRAMLPKTKAKAINTINKISAYILLGINSMAVAPKKAHPNIATADIPITPSATRPPLPEEKVKKQRTKIP